MGSLKLETWIYVSLLAFGFCESGHWLIGAATDERIIIWLDSNGLFRSSDKVDERAKSKWKNFGQFHKPMIYEASYEHRAFFFWTFDYLLFCSMYSTDPGFRLRMLNRKFTVTEGYVCKMKARELPASFFLLYSVFTRLETFCIAKIQHLLQYWFFSFKFYSFECL